MPPDVLVCAVHYRDEKRVRRFAEELSAWPEFRVAICDNSGDFGSASLPPRSIVVKAGANVGYFNGCVLAYRAAMEQTGGVPDFAIFSNSDVRIGTAFRQTLLNMRLGDSAGCLAPNVVTSRGCPQNPHLVERISPCKLWLLRSVHAIPPLGACYIRLALWRRGLKWAGPKPCRARREIYAPHGSCFILTRRFLERGEPEAFGGFLHDEEIHIAQQVIERGLRVIYEPSLPVEHEEHATLGAIGLLRQARMHAHSLSWLTKRYFSRTGRPIDIGGEEARWQGGAPTRDDDAAP